MPSRWFDAHLDLAYMARVGRDMRSADLSRCGGADPPAAVTLPSLAAGGVAACLATIFTEADGADAVGYPGGDTVAAGRRGREQMEVYDDWERERLIRRWVNGCVPNSPGPLAVGILIEGADPIASPDELLWWVERGVVAIGMAWAKSSRYAGGNTTDEPLTSLGRALVKAMDRLGVVHDASHLSDAAFAQLLAATDRPIIASHSNCRALIDTDGERRQRHLTDDAIREISRRGGIIGLNVFSPFIIAGARRDRRATLDEWAAHADHVCDIIGDREHIGLGSDMDGGFSAAMMPEGINSPRDLGLLCETLSARRWTDAEVEAFAWGNWARFWSRCPTV
ncbi:MAG: membrane dipeptidase [Phycisphaerae bacterium]|nr:membrane dipeptidase [Phycisphaerae bacterium]